MPEENTQVTEDELYTMSDEDFFELGPSDIAAEEPSEEGALADEEGVEGEEEHTDESEVDGDHADETDAEETDESDADDTADTVGEEGEEDADGEDAEESTEEEDSSEVDYKAEYERIMQPFKANGKEMKVDNVDDAIQLMQMGANYTKKMAALKPNLKMLKMLENNELLSEEKLGFYIDLEKKDPAAIKKLLKDSDIDPMELDLEEKSEYKPSNHTVDDRQVDLDMALEDIKDTPTYSKTIGIVSNKWDGQSKQAIYENPQLLNVINDHVSSGVYDVINSEIERERTLGRLTGISDLEAYRQIGDTIQERGGFDHLFTDKDKQTQKQPVKRKVAQPKGKKEDPKVKAKRRAASPNRTSPDKAPNQDYNPLSLSDDEFEKLIDSRYM